MRTDLSQKIERPQSLTEKVTNMLRLSIMEGELILGQAISEKMLSKKYGVGKTPVREALFRLKQEGVVDIIPQKGSFVYNPSAQDVNDLCDFRAYIEPLALKEAFYTKNEDFLDELEVLTIKMKRLLKREDIVKYMRLDMKFHLTFFEYCVNPHLKQVYESVSTKAAAIRSNTKSNMTMSMALYTNEQHIKVVDLLNEGNVDGAVTMLLTHITETKGEFSKGVRCK